MIIRILQKIFKLISIIVIGVLIYLGIQAFYPTLAKLDINNMEITWIIGITGGILTWLYNEVQKRRIKLLSEKEKRYENLIRLLRNLGDVAENNEKGNEFIVEFQLCWMYCPDEIIKKGNLFLDSMNPEIVDRNQKEIDKLKGEFIVELRKDLIKMNKPICYHFQKTTKLQHSDFKDVKFDNKNNLKSNYFTVFEWISSENLGF